MNDRSKKCWEFSQSQKDAYIEKLTSKLAALRAHADKEFANIIGTSRQTYYVIEGKKSNVLEHLLIANVFYDTIGKTSQMIRKLDAYSTQLIERFNDAANLINEEESLWLLQK